ncbi:MAG: DoxX family protein, partial [Proteobacteria bacterium]
MAAITETVGFVLLFLGLATRFMTIPLMVTMVVAVTTVHWSHGFSCGDNGIQIPFYFFFLLFALLIGGAGRISLDHLIAKRLIK